MAERKPLCLVDGIIKELPSGDTLPGVGGVVKYDAIKTTNESVANSTLFQDDDELTITIAETGTYLVQISLICYAAAGGLRWNFSAPTSSTWRGYFNNKIVDAATSGQINYGWEQTELSLVSVIYNNKGRVHITFEGYIIFTNTGTFKLQWGQYQSSEDTTTMYRGSTMLLIKR